MAVISVAHGHEESVLDQLETLDTQTTAGVYVFVVDTVNMANGDVTVLSIFTKAIHDGTSRLAFEAIYAHVQSDPIKYSPPIPIDTEIIVTLMQTDGTARHYDWNLLKVG
jgi:cephalosporin hydroxylase